MVASACTGVAEDRRVRPALFLATGLDEDAAAEHVAVRLGRQAILERPKPPHVVVVLDEPVLHRLIGSPQVMADQLTHIAEMSERPYVSVQVIPPIPARTQASAERSIGRGDGAPEVLRMEAVEDVTAESKYRSVRAAADVFLSASRLTRSPEPLAGL